MQDAWDVPCDAMYTEPKYPKACPNTTYAPSTLVWGGGGHLSACIPMGGTPGLQFVQCSILFVSWQALFGLDPPDGQNHHHGFPVCCWVVRPVRGL